MNEKTKKIFSIASRVVTICLVVFTVLVMVFTIFSVVTFDKNNRSLFGYSFYIVKTDSMSLNEDGSNAHYDVHFDAGDIIVTKRLSDEEKRNLKKGDVITFQSLNEESHGETITHMILDVVKNSKGEVIGYRTFGTNKGPANYDKKIVEPGFIFGKYQAKMPAVGHFFAFMKTTPGYIVCILIPFLLLILYNGVNTIRLFKQYKNEQRAAIQAERDEIDAERKRNEEMFRQLQQLQAQLAANAAATADAPKEETADAPTSTEGSDSSAEVDPSTPADGESAPAKENMAEEETAQKDGADNA